MFSYKYILIDAKHIDSDPILQVYFPNPPYILDQTLIIRGALTDQAIDFKMLRATRTPYNDKPN